MNTTNTTTITVVSEERAEGMRRMANKYGVQTTKIFLGVVDAVDAWWIAGDTTNDTEDADNVITDAKEWMDSMFDLLDKLGLNELYAEFLDTEEYTLVAMPGID